MLIPTVVQDAVSGRVLMLAYSNDASLAATRQSGSVHFWSRSRDSLWRKGETSGNTLELVEIRQDCDGDALLIRANPAGPTCHTGIDSCFGVDESPVGALARLVATISSRSEELPERSYTAELIRGGVDQTARKLLEEAGEVAFAAKDSAANSGSTDRVVEEAADLVYHLLVLLQERGVSFDDVATELGSRASG